MEHNQFDRLTRTLATEASRRRFGGLLLALGLGSSAGLGLLGAAETAAKRKKHKKEHKKKHKKGKPKVRADAGCAGPLTAFYGFGGGDTRFAQTFSPLRSGKLTSARVPISKVDGSTGDYVLHLAAVEGDFIAFPTNTVLATATLPNSTVPTGNSAPEFVFETPPAVAADTIYALLLTRPGGSQIGTTMASVSSCHSGGSAFRSDTQSGAFSPNGGGFEYDLAPFQTFVAS